MTNENPHTVNILLVEDSKSFAALLSDRIRRSLGFEVTWAADLAQAKALTDEQPERFLLAILDLHLPDAPHGQVVDQILARKIPAIVLTGDPDNELRRALFKKGVLDYFVKDSRHVIEAVIHAVGRLAHNRQRQILVVDDSNSARALLCQFVGRYGFSIIDADDGSSAWQLLNHDDAPQVDLVITDFAMPEMDGVALTRKLRSRYHRDEMAIIGLSSADDETLAARFIKAGANDFLYKPYQPEEMLSRVHQNIEWIERYRDLSLLVTRHEAVLDHAMDAIITTDGDGQMMAVNPAAEKLFGHSRESMIGASLCDHLIQDERSKVLVDSLAKLKDGSLQASELRRRIELKGERQDGQIVDLQAALSGLQDEQGPQLTAFIQDITDKRQLLKSLEETLSAAEVASRAKSAFIANMSHEVRTPMNAVLGFTDLALKSSELTPKLREYLEKSQNASRTLMGIINDILDFSKMDMGRMDLDPVKFDLHQMLDQLADLFSKQVADKGITLLFKVPSSFNLVLYGDRLRLEQILINLIRNAIKFTEVGHILVRVTPQSVEPMAGKEGALPLVDLQFAVEDSGIGIDADVLPDLFAPFVQADTSTTRRFGGTGLGLSICKRLVTMMDGTISAESSPGHGSTFHFAVKVERHSEDRRNRPALPESMWGRRVLVLDDHPVARDQLCDWLKDLSLQPHAVKDPDEATQQLLQENQADGGYDYFVMDWQLGEKDGSMVACEIRAALKAEAPELQIPRIILLTPFGMEDLKEQASRVAIDAFVDKPVQRNRLVKTLTGCEESSPRQGDRRFARKLALESEIGQQVGGAHVLLVEDDLISQQVIKELLHRVGLIVDVAHDCATALEMIQHYDYRIALLDKELPDGTGVELAATIRNTHSVELLPMLLLDSHSTKDETKLFAGSDLQGLLTKPVRSERLYGTLEHWVKIPRETIPDEMRIKLDELPLIQGFDLDAGLARVAGNRTLFKQLLANFVLRYGQMLDWLEPLFEQQAWPRIVREMHALAGAADALGALDLARAATQVEQSALVADQTALNTHITTFFHRLKALLTPLQGGEPSEGMVWNKQLEAMPKLELNDKAVELLLNKLATKFIHHCVDLQGMLEPLGQLLKENRAEPIYRLLKKQVQNYAFHEALATVQEIAKKLGCSLNMEQLEHPLSGQDRILIVDDQASNIDILVEILDSYERMVALNGLEALELIKHAPPPDIILLDIMMPQMNGYAVCKQLKTDELTASIPIIFISAKKEAVDEEEGFALGAVDYITKPFQNEVVQKRVQAQLELKRHRDRLDKQVKIRTAELEIAREQAEVRKEQAEAGNKAKSEFLAVMSHEIRTPLNAILGTSDLLAETTLSDEQANYLQIARNAGEILLNLVNETLDLSKIEAGKMDLEQTVLDLPKLLNELIQIKQIIAERKGIELSLALDEKIPHHVLGDPDRIRQILVNLLSNAVKFTEEGTVQLEVKSSGAEQVQFILKDSGIGIPQEKLERIFHPFSQADSSTTRRFGGTGLGLTICRHLSEAMGGSIQVASEVGKGSCFTLQIPLPSAGLEKINPVEIVQQVEHSAQRPLTILVADDAEDNQRIIQAFLNSSPHTILIAYNGQEALDRFKQGGVDAILMDLLMPELDGFGAIRRVREWEAEQSLTTTPIIALTALSVKQDLDRAMEAGCDFVLTKPFRKAQLLAAIERLQGMLNQNAIEAASRS
uniref:histidine kinase n=1 Tax=Magnetococcus massalia (strain MO-1) TaxID=451514 RepID=A0A1S7LKY9_MAGMO|nr:putative response regulator receiver domain modulated hybrid histidine kinase with Hpt domain [Candidatus Magnetococcus massalia]